MMVAVRDDYIKLAFLNISSNDELCGLLNRNGAANLTVCPECNIGDYSHVETCKIGLEIDRIVEHLAWGVESKC
jgi:hypothetical protein